MGTEQDFVEFFVNMMGINSGEVGISTQSANAGAARKQKARKQRSSNAW